MKNKKQTHEQRLKVLERAVTRMWEDRNEIVNKINQIFDIVDKAIIKDEEE